MTVHRYRVTNPHPFESLYCPQVRRGMFWISLDQGGAEMPLGSRWCAPIEQMPAAIRGHQTNPGRRSNAVDSLQGLPR